MWLMWFLAGMVFMFCIAAVVVHRLLVRVKSIVGTPSASHNSYYVPCFECNQLMCKAKTYYGSPECVAARCKHST